MPFIHQELFCTRDTKTNKTQILVLRGSQESKESRHTKKHFSNAGRIFLESWREGRRCVWKPVSVHGLIQIQGKTSFLLLSFTPGGVMEPGHCTRAQVASSLPWLLCNSNYCSFLCFKLLICLWLTVCWLETPPALQAVRRQREVFEKLAILLVRTDLNMKTHSWVRIEQHTSAPVQRGSVSLPGGGQSTSPNLGQNYSRSLGRWF